MKVKSIAFHPDLVPLIENGSKTFTYRFGSKYCFLEVGDKIDLSNSKTGEIFAKSKIIDKYWTTFKELPINRKGHEPYSSKDQQREIFKSYYDREILDEDKFIVIEFKLI